MYVHFGGYGGCETGAKHSSDVFKKYIYLFIFGYIGSSLLRVGPLQLWRVGATPRCSAWASHYGGLSCCRAWALGTWASAVVPRKFQSSGSVAAAHGPSCSRACGIFPDQGLNPCSLHWQADS